MLIREQVIHTVIKFCDLFQSCAGLKSYHLFLYNLPCHFLKVFMLGDDNFCRESVPAGYDSASERGLTQMGADSELSVAGRGQTGHTPPLVFNCGIKVSFFLTFDQILFYLYREKPYLTLQFDSYSYSLQFVYLTYRKSTV